MASQNQKLYSALFIVGAIALMLVTVAYIKGKLGEKVATVRVDFPADMSVAGLSKGAKVTFNPEQGAGGWNAPEFSSWLLETAENASQAYFNREAVYMGEGGTIPFMGMLGEKFPKAQFFITGVLGPQSNAHGPNEFLHIPTGKRVTMATARLIAAHHGRTK